MPARPDPNTVIDAGDGEIHDARSAVYDDGQARVDIAAEDDPAAVEAATAEIVEAEDGHSDRDDDLRYSRATPAQQAAAQSAAQATATTTADPEPRDDATLPAARKPDDPQPADDAVTSDATDEPLNPYLTEDKTDPSPDPVADDTPAGDDAAATE